MTGRKTVRLLERRISALLWNRVDAVLVVRDDRVVFAGPATGTVFGTRLDTLVGRSITEIMPRAQPYDPIVDLCHRARLDPTVTVTREVAFRVDDAELRWVSISAVDIGTDVDVDGVVVMCHDVTEQRKLHERLDHRGLHDVLTGLPNRTLFADRLDLALKRRARGGHAIGVLRLDLDGFKPVNDIFGYDAGDRVLHAVARRLRAVLRESDTVARMGSDEFAVLVEESVTREDLVRLARRLIEAIAPPVDLGDHGVGVGVSIGIALADDGRPSADDLLRNADLAMYAAKDSVGEKYRVYKEGGVPSL